MPDAWPARTASIASVVRNMVELPAAGDLSIRRTPGSLPEGPLALRAAESGDDLELRPGHRLDRESASLPRDDHLLQPFRGLQRLERDRAGEPLDELDVHHAPRRRVLRACLVEVLVPLLPRGVIRIAGLRDRRQSRQDRRPGAGG